MRTKQNITRLLNIFLFLYLHSAFANTATPIGLWQTLDDDTGKPASLIRISEKNGKFYGVIEKLLDPNLQTSVCEKCAGVHKDQPLIGMTILQGVQQKSDGYEGGEILDPDNGKIYQCKFKLINDGKKLEVRGYIGSALFGRIQIWLREE